MKKFLALTTATALMLGVAAQPAHAFFFFGGEGGFKHFKHFHHIKKPPVTTSQPKGPSTGNSGHGWFPQYVFAATTCSAVFLWLQALQKSQTEHRELTQKEAWTTVGNCYLPIVGGEIIGRLAQQP